MFIFRRRRQKEEEEPVSSSSKHKKLQNTPNNQITDLHNDGSIEKQNQIKGLQTCTTARSDEDTIRNMANPIDKKGHNSSIIMVDNQIYLNQGDVNKSMIMVDNQIYCSSTDTNDDIFMVDNELYNSEHKNDDSPVMVDNDIYVETT